MEKKGEDDGNENSPIQEQPEQMETEASVVNENRPEKRADIIRRDRMKKDGQWLAMSHMGEASRECENPPEVNKMNVHHIHRTWTSKLNRPTKEGWGIEE